MNCTLNKVISLLMFLVMPFTSMALSASPQVNTAGIKYLTIVSTETEGLEFIRAYHRLNKRFPSLEVISSRHCKNLKPGLVLLVAAIDDDKNTSDSHLKTARQHVKDSYQRQCEVDTASILAHGLPLVDQSVLKLPEGTVNWSFEDVTSSTRTVSEDYIALVKKTFSGSLDDELEGRRVEINLINRKNGRQARVIESCHDFDHVVMNHQKIAFQCVTGSAANEYIHTVYLYDVPGNKITVSEGYCQQPAFNKSSLHCKKESVNESGELKLVDKVIDI